MYDVAARDDALQAVLVQHDDCQTLVKWSFADRYSGYVWIVGARFVIDVSRRESYLLFAELCTMHIDSMVTVCGIL